MSTQTIYPAVKATEGAGVRIFRAIGSQHLRHLDPFLLLDHFDTDNSMDYLSGFPDHPHRGFITFTYMLDGQMEHQDSMGNKGTIGPGDAQWMKAAHGVIHSEMPKQIAGHMRGFQLWVNLPASEKLSAPGYQELTAEQFPTVQLGDIQVKVLIGHFNQTQSPLVDHLTEVNYLDIHLPANSEFNIPMDEGHAGFLFTYQGSVNHNQLIIPEKNLAIIDGLKTHIHTRTQSARLIVASGKPIQEPIVQHGPFVMNTQEQILQAMQDYRDGTLTTVVSS